MCVGRFLLFGEGDTETEALADHDKNMHALMLRCKEKNLKLNFDKVKFKLKEVSFIGHKLTPDGVKPDQNKCEAIIKMTKPEDAKGVQRILGIVNYLSKFLKGLTDLCQPLRKLTHKNVEFKWLEEHDKAFNSVKKAVTESPVLQYFDQTKETTLQCDASKFGLGAALLQNGQPIAYASRTLTNSERNYAQIEKELLAVVFGVEKFHQFTYGRHITVQSDHSPLETIHKKPLSETPKRLQRMLLRLQKYNIKIVYVPGKHVELADTLSRVPLNNTHRSDAEIHTEVINITDDLPVAQPLLEQIKHETDLDSTLSKLKHTVRSGWPEHKRSCDARVKKYWDKRDYSIYMWLMTWLCMKTKS